jgi:hypothetical protein
MSDKSSAKITVRKLDDGRLEQLIEHAPLPSVTPEMMLWMLEAWLRHNVEEDGNLPHMLPELYAKYAR